VHGDGLTSLQFRHADTAQTAQIVLPSNGAVNIELQRSGNTFTFSAATAGENYKIASKELQLNDEVYAGLFICSHNENVIEQAVFSNVRIIIPAAKDFRPYRDYIGSHIEVMDVQSGLRKILYSAPNSLQAPNWTRDGNNLFYNSKVYCIHTTLASGAVNKLNTGIANQNNNDHVISFDGKQMAVSNHVGEKTDLNFIHTSHHRF
jgi:Tol biopolymer transport system component